MRRIMSLFIVTLFFLFSLSGFKTVDKGIVEVVACSLSGNEAYFRVLPQSYTPGLVTLNVKIYDGSRIAALGSRKIEMLHMPVDGLEFRVPLTGNLSIHQTYRVVVDLPGNDAQTKSLSWANMAVAANSSAQFFARNFNPIEEPVTMRNQFDSTRVRGSLR